MEFPFGQGKPSQSPVSRNKFWKFAGVFIALVISAFILYVAAYWFISYYEAQQQAQWAEQLVKKVNDWQKTMPTSTLTSASLISSGIQALAMIVLVIITWSYARSTRKMSLEMFEQTKLQMRPAVDVNMIYDELRKKSFFWFSNFSNIPAFVDLKLYNKKDGSELWKQGPLRLSPRVLIKKTSCRYDLGFLSGDIPLETEVTLNISVKTALEDQGVKYEFRKHYKFHKNDNNELNWDETTWGFRDALPGETTYSP